jgi:hypothetical protein
MEREHYALQMEVCIQETSSTMKYQGEESISGLMESLTRVNGRKIKCMVMVFSHGKTRRDMKATLSMTREKGRGSSSGRMVESMMECGRMGSNMEREHLLPRMECRGLESGREGGTPSGLHEVMTS